MNSKNKTTAPPKRNVAKIVITVILSLVLAGVIAFLAYWGSTNWDAMKSIFKGSKIYTEADVVVIYENGYNAGFEGREDAELLIIEYRNNIMQISDSLSEATSNLTAALTAKTQLQTQITNLQSTITQLNSIVAGYDVLNESNSTLIANLQNQISTLTADLLNLQNANEQSNQTITSYLLQIEKLKDDLLYYQEIINNYVNEGYLVTFIFDEHVLDMFTVTAGNYATIDNPESTAYKVFMGWSVDGSTIVDLANYEISDHTVFTAIVKYYYDVKFVVDGTVEKTYLIQKGLTSNYAGPVKDGYEFDGWAVDGLIVDTTTYPITEHTTFTAVFTKLHKVTFANGAEHNTCIVRNGEFATITNPTKYGYVFEGWAVDGVIVNLGAYPITENTIFIAVFKNDINGEFHIHHGDALGSRIYFIVENGVVTHMDFQPYGPDENFVNSPDFTQSENMWHYQRTTGLKYEFLLTFNLDTGWNIEILAFQGTTNNASAYRLKRAS